MNANPKTTIYSMTTEVLPPKPGDKIRRIDPTSRSHHMIGTVTEINDDRMRVTWNEPKPKGTANASTLSLKREGIGWERIRT